MKNKCSNGGQTGSKVEVLNSYIASKSRHNVLFRNCFFGGNLVLFFLFNDVFDTSSYTASRDEIGERRNFKGFLKESPVA